MPAKTRTGRNSRRTIGSKRFERLLPSDRRRLLDIGSGPGFFLKTAKARGWKALGIEPSRQAARHARSLGLEVAEGFFNAETAPGLGRFDAIQLNNVLEHVPDPAAILIEARELLEPSGVLCVNVPNDFSPFQIAARAATTKTEWWVSPKHHLNYFDFESLAGLLERLGFQIAERIDQLPDGAVPAHGRGLHGRRSAGPRLPHTSANASIWRWKPRDSGQTRRAFYRALASVGHRPRSRHPRRQAVSADTSAFFIVSSGRSGTAMLHKALSASPTSKCITNIWCTSFSRWRCAAIMGWATREEALGSLARTYAAAVA